MSGINLPEPLRSHFLDQNFRAIGKGFERDFYLQNNPEQNSAKNIEKKSQKKVLKSSVEFLSIGSLSEGRIVELFWIFDGNIFQKMRFRAFGDAYVIGCFSWLCFSCEGQPESFLSTLSFPQIAELLKVPSHKLSSLVLLDDAIQNIIKINGKTKCKNKKMKN